MKRFLRAGLLALVFAVGVAVSLIVSTLAFAAENTVTIGWGDFVATLVGGMQQTLGVLLLAAATAVVGMLPSWMRDIVRPFVLTWRADQLFEKLAATVVAGTRGAVAGKTVDVPVANDMVRDLVKLALARGSPVVLDFAGRSVDSLAEKALARLADKGVIPPDYSLSQAKVAAGQALTS